MTIRYTERQVTALLANAARMPGSWEFTCGTGVHAYLTASTPAADPVPEWQLPAVSADRMLAQLTAVPVIVDEMMPAGEFRLVRHDSCHADDRGEVAHDRCILTAGVMV